MLPPLHGMTPSGGHMAIHIGRREFLATLSGAAAGGARAAATEAAGDRSRRSRRGQYDTAGHITEDTKLLRQRTPHHRSRLRATESVSTADSANCPLPRPHPVAEICSWHGLPAGPNATTHSGCPCRFLIL